MGLGRTEYDYEEWEDVLRASPYADDYEFYEDEDRDFESPIQQIRRLGLDYYATHNEVCGDDRCVEWSEAAVWDPAVPPGQRRVVTGYDLRDALTAFLDTSPGHQTASRPPQAVKSQPRPRLAHHEAPGPGVVRRVDQDSPLALIVTTILILCGVEVVTLYLAYPILWIPTVLIIIGVLIYVGCQEDTQPPRDARGDVPPKTWSTDRPYPELPSPIPTWIRQHRGPFKR